MRRSLLLVAPLALAACTSTYHPEYHPVTVSNVAYPVVVQSEHTPVQIAPTPGVQAAPLAAPLTPPPGFFAQP
jgi:hypothetical protein